MKHDKVYLRHIFDEIVFLKKTIVNLTYDSFIESETYTRAFSRSIEIIGEAVKNLSPGFKEETNDIDWKKIAGMRDKLIHQYFSVDYDLIWEAVKNKLPTLESRNQWYEPRGNSPRRTDPLKADCSAASGGELHPTFSSAEAEREGGLKKYSVSIKYFKIVQIFFSLINFLILTQISDNRSAVLHY